VSKRLAERAEAIRGKLDAGESFAVAAPDLAVQTREKMKRSGTVDGLDRAALASMFETANGRSGVVNKPDNVGRIVYRVTAVETPQGAGPEGERLAELNLGLQDDLLVQYVLDLQGKMGVRVNQEALRSVTGGGN
jgi:hypothetical protein